MVWLKRIKTSLKMLKISIALAALQFWRWIMSFWVDTSRAEDGFQTIAVTVDEEPIFDATEPSVKTLNKAIYDRQLVSDVDASWGDWSSDAPTEVSNYINPDYNYKLSELKAYVNELAPYFIPASYAGGAAPSPLAGDIADSATDQFTLLTVLADIKTSMYDGTIDTSQTYENRVGTASTTVDAMTAADTAGETQLTEDGGKILWFTHSIYDGSNYELMFVETSGNVTVSIPDGVRAYFLDGNAAYKLFLKGEIMDADAFNAITLPVSLSTSPAPEFTYAAGVNDKGDRLLATNENEYYGVADGPNFVAITTGPVAVFSDILEFADSVENSNFPIPGASPPWTNDQSRVQGGQINTASIMLTFDFDDL